MSRKLRLIIISCAAFISANVIFLDPSTSSATPPQAIVLGYNSNTQILSATITHKSSFTSFHYIQYVDIDKNGKSVSKNIYESQPSEETFTYTYKIPANEGDKFDVTGTCSLWGSKTVSYTIGKTKEANPPPAKVK